MVLVVAIVQRVRKVWFLCASWHAGEYLIAAIKTCSMFRFKARHDIA
jgi:hypothetical protein